jgi:acetyl-CoA carboxylase biotin carboxyl carrier protein
MPDVRTVPETRTPNGRSIGLDGDFAQRLGTAELEAAVDGVRILVELVRESTVTRLRLDLGPLHVEIETSQPVVDSRPGATLPPGAPAVPAAPHEGDSSTGAPTANTGIAVLAPLIGVFYRRPSPAEPPFVEPGDRVDAGQTVAIVEAMKLMNPVVADRAGVVREIHARDTEVVEFGQLLMTIEPG